MALNWNSQVNFSELKNVFSRKGAKGIIGGSAYPTKRSMNLYQGDPQSSDVRTVGLTAILLALAIGCFVKFGVIDQLALLSARQGELAQQEAALQALTSSTADYEEVMEVYDAYMIRYGNAGIDAIEVLDMVENKIMKAATVSAIVMSEDTLTLTLNDVPLATVGDLAKQLEGEELVSAVNVSTATTQNADGQNTVSTLVVTLKTNNAKEE